MKCANCIFWTRCGIENDLPSHVGDCSSPKMIYGGVSMSYPQDGLEYWDTEGLNAGFHTGEDFGCVNFLSK